MHSPQGNSCLRVPGFLSKSRVEDIWYSYMQGDTGCPSIIYSIMYIIVRTYTGRDLGAILLLILVVLIKLTHDGLVSRCLSSTIEN